MNRIILLAVSVIFTHHALFAQNTEVTVSGVVRDRALRETLPYANVVLKTEKDGEFVMGTVTDNDGRFTLSNIKQGNYIVEFSYVGYATVKQPLYAGSLSQFLDMGVIELSEDANALSEVVITGTMDEVNSRMEKKTYTMDGNISHSGGSTLQAMQNLPGVTVQDGKVQLRGSDKVAILVDGKQSALTGYNNQSGLDNIPASAIERIEIINNPSAKYDANGNAGIINIVFRKEKQEGFNGKAGMALGLGALWEKHENFPTIRPQYRNTPKVNPSLALNYRKNKTNIFFQGDYLYTETLNKNEFVERIYDDGQTVRQQTKRNRDTHFLTAKAGVDWNISDRDMLTFSGLFGIEDLMDRGDEPFFNANPPAAQSRIRLWQFLEDELKTTVTASAAFQHKFPQAGHLLNAGINYTFHREDEKYFFTNIMPDFTGEDAFALISDEHVADLNVDYIRPHKYGRMEAGLKFRYREIPTDMLFIPGFSSPLDAAAGGWATYRETIPALYGNYVFENSVFDIEAGLRVEYVKLKYDVNPDHPTYKSDGYNYAQPFPNVRLAWKINEHNRISAFYNRRVDRPAEVDIRIFPKYDDAEIIKVGNPELQPQFTNSFELGYKTEWKGGYLYMALYDRMTDGTITRIASIVPGRTEIYNIFQNAGKSNIAGGETVFSQKMAQLFSFSLNATAYYSVIGAFMVHNKYPVAATFSAERQEIVSGNVKFNGLFHLPRRFEVQITAVYQAPDIIPQGRTGTRFSLDAGVKKTVRNGRGEIFVNATDLLNTMKVKKEIQGDGFTYISTDYYETQVVRLGYTYKF
jgi:outer membrane receptor protein involved in Fe transport